jgi:SpoIID/LytB domain protein
VARTEVYYQRLSDQEAFWQIEASEVGYEGFNAAHAFPSIEKAVDDTRFLVLQSNDDWSLNGIFPATWTEHSGGKTAAYHTMHRSEVVGPRIGVEMPFAAQDREASQWSFSMSKAELSELLHVPKITRISLYNDAFSNKVYHIRFFQGSEALDKDFFSFQQLVGIERLKSSDFKVSLSNDTVTFTGYGEGSGTGLCLYSAQKMAHMGATAQQILGKAFPGTQLALMSTFSLKEEEEVR